MVTARRSAPQERQTEIVAAARSIAEAEGWSAVTVRRLAAVIGYSQPVLYQHFPQGKREIVAAVARAGFAELGALLTGTDPDAPEAMAQSARAYLTFAREQAATYEAMFELPSVNQFATAGTPAELRAAFDAVVALVGAGPDGELRAELLWSTLHGVAGLERAGRLPHQQREERVAEIARLFS